MEQGRKVDEFDTAGATAKFQGEFDVPVGEYNKPAPSGQVLKAVVKEEDQNSE